MVITLDKFGRVIIPKKFRKRLGIDLGAALNISEDGERIVIEPIKEKEPILEKDGILIFTGKLNGKADDIVKQDRKNRMKKLFKNED